jgi:hypothetical protein
MKKLLLATIALGGAMACFAQADSTSQEKVDTIKVGGMIIIKKKGKNTDDNHISISEGHHRHYKSPSNLTTNWCILDIGFANINDQSNYAAAQAQGFTGPGVGKDQFHFKSGKSVNVNFWLFIQRLNLIKHVVNLKYGLGLELNNYRFDDETVKFQKNPTYIYIDPALKDNVKKNKLAADYITAPLMLNFNLTPKRNNGFGFSAGVSAGYLYSSRQKIKDSDNNKSKVHDDFDLRPWKLSYIAELNLSFIHFYGSYAFKSMWDKGLDQTPYTVGIRLSTQ